MSKIHKRIKLINSLIYNKEDRRMMRLPSESWGFCGVKRVRERDEEGEKRECVKALGKKKND